MENEKTIDLMQSTKEFLREGITVLEANIAAETDANEKADYISIMLYFRQALEAMEGQDKLLEEVERLKAENAAIRQDCYTKEAVEALLEEKKAYREAFWTLLHDMEEDCTVCAHEHDDFPCERCSEDESCFVWQGLDKLRERLGHDC